MTILERVQNLLSVKSIVTIILTVVFAYLSVNGGAGESFMSVYLTVIAFYFGTQYQKTKDAMDEVADI